MEPLIFSTKGGTSARVRVYLFHEFLPGAGVPPPPPPSPPPNEVVGDLDTDIDNEE